MTRLRLNVEIKRQHAGVEFDQLARVYTETSRFLEMLAEDTDLGTALSGWVAVNARVGSFATDLECAEDLASDDARRYKETLKAVVSYEPESGVDGPPVRRATMQQYSKIGAQVASGQLVRLGISDAESPSQVEWGEISAESARTIAAAFPETINYYGDAQGRIHALFKESPDPHFHLRELSTGNLISCPYKPEMYDKIVELLKDKNAVILVAGDATANSDTRKIQSIAVDRIEHAGDISVDEFESLAGAAPEITGDLSTEDFVDRIRSEEDPTE